MTAERCLITLPAACVLSVMCALCTLTHAQTYPQKPVRVIVPFPPGGATDVFARLLATRITESLGQQFVVEQRPGASGVIGAELAARAAPDGYTLWIGQASNLSINQHLMKKLPYDPVKDFIPITLMTTSSNLLVVHPSLPVRTIKDLITLAKSKPGAINYASSGSGSPGHLAGFDITSWWGLLGPAALPRDIVLRLNAETAKAIDSGDTKERLTAQGVMVAINTSEQFATYIRSEIANWGRMVAASGARIE